MSALIRVGEPLDAITAREAATGTICRYLCILPPTDVPAVAKTIIHWIAQRASGSSRVANLLLLWRAVVDTDLSVWKRAQAGMPPCIQGMHGSPLFGLNWLPCSSHASWWHAAHRFSHAGIHSISKLAATTPLLQLRGVWVGRQARAQGIRGACMALFFPPLLLLY